jgi:CheY-like chemotaxis protein
LEHRPAQVRSGEDELSGLRVLVADPHANTRDALRELLEYWRIQVDCADSCALSLRMLRAAVSEERPYRLAILHWQLPELGGLELAGGIRGDPQLSAIPVVLTMPMLQRLRNSSENDSRVAGYLTEPFRQSQLYDCLVSALDASGAWATGFPQPRASRQLTSGLRILVVEDNQVNQKLLVWLLEKSGYRLGVAGRADARDGWFRSNSRHPRSGETILGAPCRTPRSKFVVHAGPFDGRPNPHNRHNGQRHERRLATVPGRRNGRLRIEASPARPTARRHRTVRRGQRLAFSEIRQSYNTLQCYHNND